jgi:hypothetical protein
MEHSGDIQATFRVHSGNMKHLEGGAGVTPSSGSGPPSGSRGGGSPMSYCSPHPGPHPALVDQWGASSENMLGENTCLNVIIILHSYSFIVLERLLLGVCGLLLCICSCIWFIYVVCVICVCTVYVVYMFCMCCVHLVFILCILVYVLCICCVYVVHMLVYARTHLKHLVSAGESKTRARDNRSAAGTRGLSKKRLSRH